MMSPILSATPVNAFAFSANGHNKNSENISKYLTLFWDINSDLIRGNEFCKKLIGSDRIIFSGAMGGATSALIACPSELVKCILQEQVTSDDLMSRKMMMDISKQLKTYYVVK